MSTILELIFQEFIFLLIYPLYIFDVDISDINECINGMDDCSAKAACTNTAGSFYCTCNTGFTDVLGDGTQCEGKSDFRNVFLV